MNLYRRPMQPAPGLEPYGRTFHLPRAGLALFAYVAGPADGLPVLLVHGLGDEADTWRHVIPPLSAAYRVVAPDLPGFGRSADPPRAYSPPFYQDVLLELLDVLGIERAVLAGHSLGAVIVHSLALAQPARVERLVLVAGSLLASGREVDRATLLFLVPGLGEWLYTRLRADPQAAYRSLAPFYSHLDRLPEADREFLFRRVNERVWSDGQRRAFLSTLRGLARWLPGQQRALPALLADLRVPTVVVWGDADRVANIAGGRALVEAQPSARLVVVPGAGHNVHQERPDAILDAIRA